MATCTKEQLPPLSKKARERFDDMDMIPNAKTRDTFPKNQHTTVKKAFNKVWKRMEWEYNKIKKDSVRLTAIVDVVMVRAAVKPKALLTSAWISAEGFKNVDPHNIKRISRQQITQCFNGYYMGTHTDLEEVRKFLRRKVSR